MRKILFITLSLLISTQSFAEEMMICSALNYSKVKKIVESQGSYDKYKHCAVSCLLTLRCPASEVFNLGVLKELADMVGPGNAEWDDLKADAEGIKLVTSKKAKTDQQCIDQCKLIQTPATNCSL